MKELTNVQTSKLIAGNINNRCARIERRKEIALQKGNTGKYNRLNARYNRLCSIQ